MVKPPRPDDEEQRIEALRSLNVLYTPAEDRFDRITRLACRLLDVPIALVSLVDSECQWFKSTMGLTASQTSRTVSFCAHAIADDEPLVIEDARKDPRFSDNPLVTGEPNIRFYAGQPLLGNNGERLGTLCVIDQRRRNVSVDELEILRDLAGWCSNELRLVSLSRVQRELISECDELRRRAMVDPLTQLWNRAAIQEILTRELERARRGKAWLSLVFADIDHFKNVNDTYGHSAGDDMLRQVAGRIRSSVRAYDAVGRFGGEEFLVVASECSEWDGGTLANRLRVNVGDRTFDTTWGPIQITLSAGVAVTQLGEEKIDPKTLLAAADRALYRAKNKGRNLVEIEPVH